MSQNKTEEMKKNEISEGKTEENKEEKPKKKKDSSKSSKTKEKDIYFIIFYQRKQKENENELVFSKDCDISPQIILNKDIKLNNNKYAYKKVFKFKNISGKKNVKLAISFGEEVDKSMTWTDMWWRSSSSVAKV